MVAPSFGMLGLQSRELIDYVTRLLADFARADELYRIRDARGRRLETVAAMLLELMRAWNPAIPYHFEREVEVRRHCGDYTLFICGLFRAHLEAESLLGYYLEQGLTGIRHRCRTHGDDDVPTGLGVQGACR